MHRVLGDLLPYAVPVALSPLPIIAAIMLLLSPNGPSAAGGLIVGRLAALGSVAFLVSLLAARLSGAAPLAEAGGWLRIAAGCVLIGGAFVVWRRRPKTGEAALPKWMRSIEGASSLRALVIGILLSVANLKEVAFAAGAGMLIGASGAAAVPSLLLSALFAGIACLSLLAPTLWAVLSPEGSRPSLQAARDWLASNNAIVVAAVLLLVGAMLIGSGVEAL